LFLSISPKQPYHAWTTPQSKLGYEFFGHATQFTIEGCFASCLLIQITHRLIPPSKEQKPASLMKPYGFPRLQCNGGSLPAEVGAIGE